jgi:hypothetical protein
MSVKKFKFVSPGIFINEIDNSQLPSFPLPVGPVVIGRSLKGPAFRPVKVDSYEEFVRIFGNPVPGGEGGDVWRYGNKNGPTYAAYAAKAWLRNNSPLTFVRLLGAQHSNAVTAGKAGWSTAASTYSNTIGSNGGAYGLFMAGSGSLEMSGTLAAVWYLNEGGITLSGTKGEGVLGGAIDHAGVFVSNIADKSKEFKVNIRNEGGTVVETVAFNFNPTSHKYIRKVFNTNPQLTNSTVVTDTKTYWLGETFERSLADYVTGSTQIACILGLGTSTTAQLGDQNQGMKAAKTGWFFGQHLNDDYAAYKPENMQKLFRLVALSEGEWVQNNLKISVEDIRPSTNDYDKYGTFSIVLRRMQDNDRAVQVVERFDLCNLNPDSDNYVAKKIGDYYEVWSDVDRRYTGRGNHPNMSSYIYVEPNEDVDDGATDELYLPFGVYGPPQYKGFTISGSGHVEIDHVRVHEFNRTATDSRVISTQANVAVVGNKNLPNVLTAGTNTFGTNTSATTTTQRFVSHESIDSGSAIQLRFPHFALRISASDAGTSKAQRAYFGFDSLRKGSKKQFDRSNVDIARTKNSNHTTFHNGTLNAAMETSWYFSLDDVRTLPAYNTDVDNATDAFYASGSRAAGVSVSAVSSSWSASLDAGWNRFTAPFFGGFDGLDITEIEPFRNTGIALAATETNAYEFNSVKRAVDAVSDPEIVEMNLASIPGLTNQVLTEHLIDVCSSRGDAMAVIDLENDYIPSSEGTRANGYPKQPDVTQAVKNLKNRVINSSYGACYFPWLRMRDEDAASTLWVPPSVAALGVMSAGDARHELWFAPAGFTRGGLENSAGVKIVGVRQKLTSEERDKLYEANINPIASFPAEGIVVFGQKTLQVTPSALDRINVRRLLIFLKKEISRMAATVLFDQNVQQTWTRFLGKVVPFLDSVKTRLGLVAYKVILDETTTTPELIDRNIMYAKIILKPARAIEFIALDFVITDSGASFED